MPSRLPWAHVERSAEVRADTHTLRALGHLGALGHAPAAMTERAAAALEAVAAFAPSDGAVLDRWNPVLGRHETLAVADVPVPDLPRQAADTILADPGYQYVRARRVAHRRCDVPRAAQNALITDLCDPAGYREGVTACLFSGGRYTGMLNLGIVDDHPLEPWRMTVLTIALDDLARLTDMTATIGTAAAALPPGAPATVLHADGRAEALPGRAPLDDVAVLDAARRHAPRHQGSTAFLLRRPELRRVLVLRLGDAGAAGTLLVATEPADTPLSVRELEVLTHITRGRPNPEIGRALGISAHTVARHVEHILGKLGVTSRVEAAACAVREGLVLD